MRLLIKWYVIMMKCASPLQLQWGPAFEPLSTQKWNAQAEIPFHFLSINYF